jgi:hypothetical protein
MRAGTRFPQTPPQSCGTRLRAVSAVRKQYTKHVKPVDGLPPLSPFGLIRYHMPQMRCFCGVEGYSQPGKIKPLTLKVQTLHQTFFNIHWQINMSLSKIAIELDGSGQSIYNNLAVGAMVKVSLNFLTEIFINITINVFVDIPHSFVALTGRETIKGHLFVPPSLCCLFLSQPVQYPTELSV